MIQGRFQKNPVREVGDFLYCIADDETTVAIASAVNEDHHDFTAMTLFMRLEEAAHEPLNTEPGLFFETYKNFVRAFIEVPFTKLARTEAELLDLLKAISNIAS